MDNFKKFLSEQSDEQPYKIICFYNTGDSSRDVTKDGHIEMINTMSKAIDKSGNKIHFVDYNGTFLSYKNNKTYINYFPIDKKTGEYISPDSKDDTVKYAEPLEVDKENTLFLLLDQRLQN